MSLKSLKQNGRYLLANVGLSIMLRGFVTSRLSSRKVVFELANMKTKDLVYLADLLQAAKIRSVIDRCYLLEQTIDAHTYIESGHKQGHVVLTVAHSEQDKQEGGVS